MPVEDADEVRRTVRFWNDKRTDRTDLQSCRYETAKAGIREGSGRRFRGELHENECRGEEPDSLNKRLAESELRVKRC